MAIAKLILGGIITTGLFLRATISLFPHSGQSTPPLYGDFEAQRHWQEITVNLPLTEWYENTTNNDLLYWGLDYPPLTAYHSFLCGKVAEQINPDYVALHKSRGIRNDNHKNFMRLSVIMADALIYLPAIVVCLKAVYDKVWPSKKSLDNLRIIHYFIAVCYSGQILIDNGHFQYNNISLGLAMLGIVGILREKYIIGSFFYVLALNYKQMELYHALPFFFYLLAKCVPSDNNRISFFAGLKRLISIGMIVISTFVLLWFPWLSSLKAVNQVIHRIFPIARGVFEDKVSNFWCILNVFWKIRIIYTNDQMAIICLTTTLVSVLPTNIHLFLKPKLENFILALISTSLGFFLFSFHVHEKTILLVTMPFILLFPQDPIAVIWFLQIATFSMLPLLVKDGLLVAYVGLTTFFLLTIRLLSHLLMSEKPKHKIFIDFCRLGNFLSDSGASNSIKAVKNQLNKSKKGEKSLLNNAIINLFYISLLGQIVLTFGHEFLEPPDSLPHLYPLLVSAYSAGHFIIFYFYITLRQLFWPYNK